MRTKTNILRMRIRNFNSREKLTRLSLMLTSMLMAVVPVHCDAWGKAKNATEGFFTQVTTFYKDDLFIVLLFINIAALCLTHEEKKIALYQKSLMAICFLFLFCVVPYWFKDLLSWFGSLLA